MITIHFTLEDLSKIRFAYNPLTQVAHSYQLLLKPDLQLHFSRWVDEAQRALYGTELPYLEALVSGYHYIPDFLTPTPLLPQQNLREEIEQMVATPDDLIRKNVQLLIDKAGTTEIRQHYLAYPREAIDCLAEEIWLYWQRTLAHHWARMVAVLEGDILYRARVLATQGADTLLGDLHPKIHYEDRQLRLLKSHAECDGEYQLNGDGLHLVPTIFACRGPSYQLVPEWEPMLIYTVRGAGLWNQQPSLVNQSLELVLGAGRARVLQALSTPSNTGELAHQLQITAGAISQHLGLLNNAGLVEPHRSGKRVFYHLTQRGQQLLDLFDASN